ALTGADDSFLLADQIPLDGSPADQLAGLAAVRVLGADALAPFVLAGHRFGPDDADVVVTSIRTFPVSEPDRTENDDNTALVRELRDWATGRALIGLGAPGPTQLYPEQARPGVGRDGGWMEWTGMLAQLSPMAVPGLDSLLHADARRYRLDVARGVTRAMLRRDPLTAARLARWLAASGDAPMDPPFLVEPVLRNLELVAKPDHRLRLEIAIARYGLGGGGE
ncbi:MAG: hypothetical protein ACRDSH_05795, partial [Pseudonocardiaceae bacterium]